jgi:hypothetical protein
LANQARRRHGQGGAQHAADHDLEAGRLRRGLELQRLGQATCLVELDVDHVITPRERRQRGPVVAGFVGADRDRPFHPGKGPVVFGMQRLLDHGHSQCLELRRDLAIEPGAPAFVGIDHQARLRRAFAHGLDARQVLGAGQLQLEQGALGIGRRGGAHVLHAVERERIGGGQGARLRQSGQHPGRLPRELRLEIPIGAVERVSRRARRQALLQRRAVKAGLDLFA